MPHTHCILDTEGYKYTHSVCVIFVAFPLQQMVARTRLIITLHVHYLSCFVHSFFVIAVVKLDSFHV